MDISFARAEDRNGLEEVWRQCFDADEAYLKLYFASCYKAEETLVCREDGQVAGMLCLLPCTYRLGDKTYSCRYVFAVGTLPYRQGGGVSTELLQATDKILEEAGTDLAVLAPATESLFGFYKKRGYDYWFAISQEEYPPLLGGGQTALTEQRLSAAEYVTRREKLCGGDYMSWDEGAMNFAKGESELYGGGLFLLKDGEREAGLCNIYHTKGKLTVKELLTQRLEDRETAVNYIRSVYKDSASEFRFPKKPGEKGKMIGVAKWYTSPPTPTGEAYLSFILD